MRLDTRDKFRLAALEYREHVDNHRGVTPPRLWPAASHIVDGQMRFGRRDEAAETLLLARYYVWKATRRMPLSCNRPDTGQWYTDRPHDLELSRAAHIALARTALQQARRLRLERTNHG